jgi:SAM-dependent methyltransferase
MNDFWNERYATSHYIYGTEPNEYLKDELLRLKPGKILFPAEGEGRNAVYAAKLGWDVIAFDPSIEGKKKAIHLAKIQHVTIDYHLKGYEEVDFHENTFDVIGLTYTHINPELRTIMHRRYCQWLKPGGTLILEAFSKEQLQYSSGGPRDYNMLFSKEELADDFSTLKIASLEQTFIDLTEGSGHQGQASIIRFKGVKK